MAEKQEITISGWIKRIGELRDGFLVGVGLLYIIGYIVWAYNAWRNNIGLIPAIDFQYFVAGIVPTLYLLGLYFAIKISLSLRKMVQFYLSSGVKGWRLILRNVLFIIFGFSILGFFLGIFWTSIFFGNFFPKHVGDELITISLAILVLCSFFLPPLQNVSQSIETAKKTLDEPKSSFEDKRESLILDYLYDSFFPDTKFFRFLGKILDIIFTILLLITPIISYFYFHSWDFFLWTFASIFIIHIFKRKSSYKKWITFFPDSNVFRLLGTILYTIVFILGLVIVYYLREHILLAFGLAFFSYLIIHTIVSARDRAHVIEFFRWWGSGIAIFYIILMGTVGIFFLIEYVYPNIPQEFGGPQPRCAQLDVITAQLSDETRKAILPINVTGSDSQVMRSNKVDVFFLGSDFLIIKPFIEKRGNVSEIFEIRRSNIETIVWCRS